MRKEKEVRIEEGRDAGKVFKITEMPAFQMDRWATRALIALGRAKKGGIATLGSMSIDELLSALSEVDYQIAEPLLQELIDSGRPFQFRQGLDERMLAQSPDGELMAQMLAKSKYHGDFIFAYSFHNKMVKHIQIE